MFRRPVTLNHATWSDVMSNDKRGYLLLAQELLATAASAGFDRSGVRHGPRVRNTWPMLEMLTKEKEAASVHAVMWSELAT